MESADFDVVLRFILPSRVVRDERGREFVITGFEAGPPFVWLLSQIGVPAPTTRISRLDGLEMKYADGWKSLTPASN